jgi:protein-disulfide isomerase
VAVGLFGILIGLRWVPFSGRRQAAALLGVAVWVALYKSGIDPVISGLAVGLVTSAYPPARTDLERVTELWRTFREQPTPELARSAQLGAASVISPNERLQYRLHPWTSFVIVPLFALANVGIHIDGELISRAATSPITLGILFGYVVGKPVGILGVTWLASRPRFGLRRALSWPVAAGGATVAGIGFTVSLLISSIALSGRQLEEAKLGVLAAAIAAALLAWGVFGVVRRLPDSLRARQISGTRDDILDLSQDVDPERDHIRGSDDAPVTLVEYGDYQCSYCGQAEVVIRELLDSFGDDLRYVWRHLPLTDVHEHAQMAAEATEAAAEQDDFWPMHDVLLEHQGDLNPRDLTGYARDLGLDVDRFWDGLRTRRHAPHVAEDVASADASGVAGTPSFFINGRRHQGAYDVSTLTAAVRAARGRAQARAQADAQPAR